jgi:glycosidase
MKQQSVRALVIGLMMFFVLVSCQLITENTATQVAPTLSDTPDLIQEPSPTPMETVDYPWWNNTVFYEIFVRSFYDSDGDGIGDFRGLTEKLDYLNDGDPSTVDDLGITGIWLMPIHPSPSYHGYDVTDYYAINPDYGSLEDFRAFLESAHQRGIRVVIDLVINHTSDQHPWFIQSRNPDSEYRDFYVWRDKRPPMSGWHTLDDGQSFYYGLFWSGMPDLNYENPTVTEEMMRIVDFWLADVGVDGFRLDAARHLVEDGTENANTLATHNWFKDFRKYYKAINPDALTIAEVWDSSILVAEYLQGDELDIAFDFDLADAYVRAAQKGVSLPVLSVTRRDIERFEDHQFAVFLTNHDQNRIASQLGDDVDKNKVAAAMLLLGPGVPFIYYGEEIGMLGIKPDEDIRTPMQWTTDESAGFTTGEPWRAVNTDYVLKNATFQMQAADSLLTWYRTLIHLRNAHPALQVGDVILLDGGHRAVFATLRVSFGEKVLVVINLGDKPLSKYEISMENLLLGDGVYSAVSLLDDQPLTDVAVIDGGLSDYQPLDTLDAFEVLVIELTPKD